MEGIAGVLIFIAIIIGAIAVCVLCGIVAYKYLSRTVKNYNAGKGVLAVQPVEVQQFISGDKTERYIEEAQEQRQRMLEWIKQAEEMSRQKAQENSRKIMSDIKSSARREIGKEFDSAVGQVRREYDNLTASDAGVI